MTTSMPTAATATIMVDSLTRRETMGLVLAPKFTAVLSLIGSSIIIGDLFRRKYHHDLKLNCRHRLLIAIGLCDLISSFGWFLTSWPMPKDVPNTTWNVGNVRACEAQGFLVQFSVGTIVYNSALAFYYLLVIRQGWSEEKVAKKAEPIFHLLSLGFAFSTSIIGLVLDLYNPGPFNDCWINSSPFGCKGDECTSAHDATIYSWILFYVPLWVAWLVVLITMILIYIKVRAIEIAGARYQQGKGQARRFALQASMYVGAFYLTWFFITINRIIEAITGKTFYFILFIAVLLAPMQGFFNCIVYFMPRYQSAKRRSTITTQRSSMMRRMSGLELPRASQLKQWDDGEDDNDDDPAGLKDVDECSDKCNYDDAAEQADNQQEEFPRQGEITSENENGTLPNKLDDSLV